MSRNNLLDEAGEQVVHFIGDVRTLGKVGELADKIMSMAQSGSWRRYRTAVGVDSWRACEFDYFLISCDIGYEDVYRAIKWHKLGDETRAMMDQNASSDRRRPFVEAAKSWHAPSPETLTAKAARLGWTKSDGSLRSPLSRRQQAQHAAGGKTMEERAREKRAKRVTTRRRRELDRLVRDLLAELVDDDERRYLLDVFARSIRRDRGRPRGDQEQWARDVAELNGDTTALAEHWGVSRRQAQDRARLIRELSAQARLPASKCDVYRRGPSLPGRHVLSTGLRLC